MGYTIPEGMEASCIRAGVWRVEGYDVERIRVDGKDWWHVFCRRAVQVREDEPFTIHETFHGKHKSLTDACDLIYEILVEQGRMR